MTKIKINHTKTQIKKSSINNYIFLLEKVLTEPWLGLLIKPKKPATLKKRLGKISDLLQQAEKIYERR